MSPDILFGENRPPDVGHTALHPDYENLLRRLNDNGVPYVLIGAMAVSLAGSHRLTRDLDAVCRDLRAMANTLYEMGFRIISHPIRTEPGAFVVFSTPEAAVEALKNSGRPSFKCLHIESRRELDVWIASPDASKLAMEDIEAHAVNAVLSGLTVKRACAEHLIVMKRIAIADSPARQHTDGPDIAFLEAYLKEHGPEIG